MREGRLGYNCENGRYGLLSMDLWIDTGFHCGEGLEVLVDDEWVQTRMETACYGNYDRLSYYHQKRHRGQYCQSL